jgi:hypothetical protein
MAPTSINSRSPQHRIFKRYHPDKRHPHSSSNSALAISSWRAIGRIVIDPTSTAPRIGWIASFPHVLYNQIQIVRGHLIHSLTRSLAREWIYFLLLRLAEVSPVEKWDDRMASIRVKRLQAREGPLSALHYMFEGQARSWQPHLD